MKHHQLASLPTKTGRPTGKLKYAYETIANMEEEIRGLRVKIKKLENPDIYWLKDNPEDGSECAEELISEFLDSGSIGQIFEFEVASRLPNIKVKFLGENDDGSLNLEYITKENKNEKCN